MIAKKYRVENVTYKRHDSFFLLQWRLLIKNSQGPEKIYQTPEFFEYLLARDTDRQKPELLAMVCEDSSEVVGIIPIRFRTHQLDFSMGSYHFGTFNIPCVVLLGSVPLLSNDKKIVDLLFSFLFEKYPTYDAISIPSLPKNDDFLILLQASNAIKNHCITYLIHGWRDCHRIPLPTNFSAYLQQFGAKRRYNLNRQIRLLREYCKDDLVLRCVQKPEQVESLCKTLEKLAPKNKRNQLLSMESLYELARHELLLCYILECDKQPKALMLGTCSDDTLHLHNILYDIEFSHLSIGTSILFMAIEDLCDNKHFLTIDFGYGTPAHSHQSSNITMLRGQMLVLKSKLKNILFLKLHKTYCDALEWTKGLIQNKYRETDRASNNE